MNDAAFLLIVSCQRHRHHPHDYLRDVLGRLPAMTAESEGDCSGQVEL